MDSTQTAPTENTGDEGLRERQLYEKVESLFDLKISSSGHDITIYLGGEQMSVEYEAFLKLRQSIEALIRQDRRELLERLISYGVPVTYKQDDGHGHALPVGNLIEELQRLTGLDEGEADHDKV